MRIRVKNQKKYFFLTSQTVEIRVKTSKFIVFKAHNSVAEKVETWNPPSIGIFLIILLIILTPSLIFWRSNDPLPNCTLAYINKKEAKIKRKEAKKVVEVMFFIDFNSLI